MPTAALLLALAAAGLHALWNVLVAGAKDSEAATAIMLVVAVVVFAPAAALTWDVQWRAAPYIAASGVFELAYFALLAAAYRSSELSLVYPLARGLAPVIVLAVTVTILTARTSAAQVVGVLLVGAGVVLVRGLRRAADPRGAALGVAIAACIAGYTILDKEGLRYASPIAYLEAVSLVPTAAYLAGVAAAKGRSALRAELRPRALAAGLGVFGAYALVLAALERGPAAGVAAVRETSVIIATALAVVVLREKVGPRRLAGAAIVAGGVALIGLS